MYCPKCGAYNEEASKFCAKCGQPLTKVTPPAPTAAKRRDSGLLKVALGIVAVLAILGASWAGFRWYQGYRAEQRVGLAKPMPPAEPTARLEPMTTLEPTARPEPTPKPEPTATPTPKALYLKLAEPVAIVNEVPIRTDIYQKMVRYYRSNLENQLALLQDQLSRLDPDDQSTDFITQYYQQQVEELQNQLIDVQTLGEQVLDDLVDDELIRQEAARRGIAVTSEEVQLEIETQFGYERNPPTPTPTPVITATLTITPTPTATPITLDRFQEMYDTTLEALKERSGFSEADFRRIFETMLLRRKLQEAMGEEVPTMADQVHARQIQVKNEEQAQAILTLLEKDTNEASALDALWLLLAEEGEVKTEEEIRAEKDPQKLLTQLRESEDPFAFLAENFSQDTRTKDLGGDLGWFSKGMMVPEFEEAAFNTPTGEIDGPVETQFGWHVIFVQEKAEEPAPQARARHIMVDTEEEAQAVLTLLEEVIDEDTALSALDILIEAEVARTRAKEEEAQELWTQFQESDDRFAFLAENFSDDIRSKDKGGDLDWFPRGEMTPEFEEAAFSLAVGEISEPIPDTIGYHIIQVLGHEERELAPDILERRKAQTFEDWLEEQRQSEAVERYWSLDKLNEELIQTYLSEGQIYLSENDLEHAEEAYAKALELNPNIIQAHSALGYIYSRQGKLQEAVQENLKVLEISPNDYASHKNLALLYQQLGRIDEAVAEAQIALGLAPEGDKANLEAFIAQLRPGQPTTSPDEALIQTYLSEGQTYLNEKDFERAEEAYAKALELNPNIIQAHSALGYIYALQGKLQEALEENLKVLELAPNDYATHKNLAMIYQQLGRIEEAIAEAETALELAPESDRPALEAFIAQLREQISP